ncbi:MAG: tRNA guanosine(34) transglycosylase Tgt, partial [Anaerolineae bacterium]|nr:tRNA guanosine(34) transglycosylase Tgt [Anaerolineae bacterium]
QVFSLTQINKIDDEGVTFRSHIDGSQRRLTPESSMAIQQALGADIIMAFDQCPPPTDRETVEKAVERTHAWAARCREAHPDDSQQALFGIVQGGIFPDLREQSAQFIQSLDFKGYAIGGLAVGETKAEQYATLDQTLPIMRADRPRYLMGVGDPDDLCQAITRGIDLFDCVIPTRLARHGAAFTFDGRVNMKNAKFKEDERPLILDADFQSYSQNFSRAYLRHLMIAKELLAYYLLSLNNIAFLITHVQNMRQAIIEGRLAQYTESFLQRYLGQR